VFRFKRIVLIIFLMSIAILDIAVYWNTHLYYESLIINDNEEKIELLDKANQYFPFNDLVFYELGKTFYDLGYQNLNDSDLSASLFQKSVSNYHRSLMLNPASQFCHFNLAHSIFYLNVLSPSMNLNSDDELKKAALLVDQNGEIFLEVGKNFLSRWDELSEEDQLYAIDILKRIMETKKWGKLQNLFHDWEINVENYELINRILPEDSHTYRRLAEYLGERALFIEKRHELFVEAEILEFEDAKREYQKGVDAFYSFRLKEASEYFSSCLSKLEKIRFYQNLTQQKLIDYTDFIQLKKFVYLYLAKCSIEENKHLLEAKDFLTHYLELEDNGREIKELESYLIERKIIDRKLENSLDILDKFYIHLCLAYKQSRYLDIVRVGRLIETSYMVIPEEEQNVYVKILQIVGDAFHQVGNIYDAKDYYEKAYDLDPDNLDTLIKMNQDFKRLNDEIEIQKTDLRIEEILFPKNMKVANPHIRKGRRLTQNMVLDGRKIVLVLYFESILEGTLPLVTILFNGQVVWEDYLQENEVSLSLEPKVGENELQVVAVNKEISLSKLSYRFLE